LPSSYDKFIYSINILGEEAENKKKYYAQIIPEKTVRALLSEKITDEHFPPPLTDVLGDFYAVQFLDKLKGKQAAAILNVDEKYYCYVLVRNGAFVDAWSFRRDKRSEEENFNDLVSELKIVLNCKSGYDEISKYDIVYLCGDIPTESILTEKIESEIGAGVGVVNPFEKIDVAENIEGFDQISKNQHRYTAAFGAALSIIQNRIITAENTPIENQNQK
jgi:hypothetical protein